MQTEDGSIISKCLNGEPEAFGILVDKYKSGIYAFVYTKLNDFRDAQDVTQDVFVEAFCKLHSLKRWESFAFWLYRIASNLCKRWIRTKIRHPEPEFIEDQNPLEIDSIAVKSYRDDQMNQLIREAMDSLPEIYREILLLYYFGGMNSNEIARALGVSPTAILQRLTRARAQLKEDIIDMIGTTFNEKKLGSGFTFRIVEAVKRLKINPVSTTKGLPWGLSLATGLMIAVLSFNPDMTQNNQLGSLAGSPLLVESKVLKIGEIPVDVVKTSENTIISNKLGKADNGEPKKPDVQNVFMSPLAEGGTWTKKTDMPTGRHNFSASMVNGKIYSIGGIQFDNVGNFTVLSDVTEYDPFMDKWTKKTDMTEPRFNHNACVINDKIYVIGGADKNGLPSETVQNIMEYDPELDKWHKKADMPEAVVSSSSCVLDGKIYIIGGMRHEKEIGTSTVEEYDPIKDEWTKKSDMPTARDNFCIAAVNGYIYAIGGMIDAINPARTTEAYDPTIDKWLRKADPITLRGGLSASVVNGKIFVIGGMDTPNTFCSTVEEYDPTTDTWKSKEDMPTKRYGLSTTVFDGKIYAIGGSISTVFPWVDTSVVEEYTPEDWSVSPQGKLPNTWGKIKVK